MSMAPAAGMESAQAVRVNIHASCVALGEVGVLLRGPSGSGKSDLALRLIEGGADLVADDRVDLHSDGVNLIAAAPPTLAGLIEAAGLGPLAVPHRAEVTVGMIVDLVPRRSVERLPDPVRETILGIDLPRFRLDAFGAATPSKLRLLATGAHVVTKIDGT